MNNNIIIITLFIVKAIFTVALGNNCLHRVS